MRSLVLALALLVGCGSNSSRWRTVRSVANGALLGASVAALGLDWCGTRDAAASAWSGGRYEGGWPAARVMGPAPSTGRVDLYFAAWVIGDVALWALLPERWRAAAPVALVIVEAPTVAGNLRTTSSQRCGR